MYAQDLIVEVDYSAVPKRINRDMWHNLERWELRRPFWTDAVVAGSTGMARGLRIAITRPIRTLSGFEAYRPIDSRAIPVACSSVRVGFDGRVSCKLQSLDRSIRKNRM